MLHQKSSLQYALDGTADLTKMTKVEAALGRAAFLAASNLANVAEAVLTPAEADLIGAGLGETTIGGLTGLEMTAVAETGTATTVTISEAAVTTRAPVTAAVPQGKHSRAAASPAMSPEAHPTIVTETAAVHAHVPVLLIVVIAIAHAIDVGGLVPGPARVLTGMCLVEVAVAVAVVDAHGEMAAVTVIVATARVNTIGGKQVLVDDTSSRIGTCPVETEMTTRTRVATRAESGAEIEDGETETEVAPRVVIAAVVDRIRLKNGSKCERDSIAN